MKSSCTTRKTTKNIWEDQNLKVKGLQASQSFFQQRKVLLPSTITKIIEVSVVSFTRNTNVCSECRIYRSVWKCYHIKRTMPFFLFAPLYLSYHRYIFFKQFLGYERDKLCSRMWLPTKDLVNLFCVRTGQHVFLSW